MIFQSKEWFHVENHHPLVLAEVKALKANIANSGMLLHWLVSWAEALAKMCYRQTFYNKAKLCGKTPSGLLAGKGQPKEEACPDYYYQLEYSNSYS